MGSRGAEVTRHDKIGLTFLVVIVVALAAMMKSCSGELSATKDARAESAAACSPMAPDLWGSSGNFTCYCDAKKVKP